MCSTAAHLTDRVFPDVPIRQWVLSVPFELRLLLAKNAAAPSAVGRIFVRALGVKVFSDQLVNELKHELWQSRRECDGLARARLRLRAMRILRDDESQ